MKILCLKVVSVVGLLCFLSSCAVKKDQFAHAVLKGNVQAAANYHEPGFANKRFYPSEAPGKYSLPIQYAILQKNKPMAKFLLDNGSTNKLNGQNLTYYCAYNGKNEMARYFASIGAGSSSDITKAKRDLADARERRRQANARTGLIAMKFLSAIMGGGSSRSSRSSGNDGMITCPRCNGHGELIYGAGYSFSEKRDCLTCGGRGRCHSSSASEWRLNKAILPHYMQN